MTNGALINKRTFWYCLYRGDEPVLDEDGYETGDEHVAYDEPVEIKANVSPASGHSNTEAFGNFAEYDKIISPLPLNCPIDEQSVLFLDKAPEYEDGRPQYDYVVRRVARSLNHVAIAVSRVP